MALSSTIGELLDRVIRNGASDLHLSVGEFPVMRIDGVLEKLDDTGIVEEGDIEEVMATILSQNQRDAFQKWLELDFSFSHDGDGVEGRFRGNCYFELGNPAMALRLIPTEIRTIGDLLLPEALVEICDQRRGLFLVTGPTGHGKSTTLAACLQHINLTRKEHIITIEDPIEYLHKSENSVVHQREIGEDTKSFADALKHVLRQDPDVILIGEMRDLETVSAAITAAETGHLVFATLHTRDAPQSVDRIIDVFPSHQQQQVRLQLASSLVGICSQQLVPLHNGGRIVVTELLQATAAVRHCVKEGKSSQLKGIIQTSLDAGMHTMEQDLARLVLRGTLTLDQARPFAYDKKDLERLVFEGME
ncbi:MAG: type IV pili twitching motility protein PilT [Dethiosulfovibrio peptidovorans]|nr:MAG: type IV pili twitching motility protein PilT [Dethiosulfovibrio peptidovorans]